LVLIGLNLLFFVFIGLNQGLVYLVATDPDGRHTPSGGCIDKWMYGWMDR
jgi:hypothetical protein